MVFAAPVQCGSRFVTRSTQRNVVVRADVGAWSEAPAHAGAGYELLCSVFGYSSQLAWHLHSPDLLRACTAARQSENCRVGVCDLTKQRHANVSSEGARLGLHPIFASQATCRTAGARDDCRDEHAPHQQSTSLLVDQQACRVGCGD
jgi:hypothetical protein